MPPRIVLATIGSLGDLHPFIAVGLALRARGAHVVVACAAEYRGKVECAGLGFRAVRPSFGDLEETLGMNRSEMTSAVLERNDFLLRRLIMPHLRESYEDMVSVVHGADVVLTSSLAFAARLAAEKQGIPWVGVVLQPLMFLSAFDPPVIPGAEWLSAVLHRLGPLPNRWVLGLLKRVLGAQLGPVRRLRRRIGLAPTRQNPLFEGQFSRAGAIGLYSSVLGDVREDYPQPTTIAGFASFDSDDGAPAVIEESLHEFLAAGAKPLVFTLGSLIVNSPGAFFRESVAAARQLGRRAVLLVGGNATAAYAAMNSPDVHVAGYAPHSLLFPRAAVIVHQGGIGTLAEGLRSGRPQLIVPFYADQIDNAARAVRLGLARRVPPRRYDARAAAHEIDTLMRMPAYAARAMQVCSRLAREDGADRAASLVLDRLESPGWASDS